MEENPTSPTTPVQSEVSTQGPLRPHRGVAVLVLGILGILVCFICGIAAWVMGKKDLQEMDAGRMDPAGRGLTQAGKICGMVSVILWIVGFAIWLIAVVLVGAGAAMSR